MAELDFAAWTATIGTSIPSQRAITTGGVVLEWETEVVRDRVYALTTGDTVAQVTDAGRYLARYDFGIQRNPQAFSPTRAAVRATLRLNGVDQVQARALGYWRNAEQCTEGHCAAAAILDLAALDELSVFAQRIDTSGNNGSTNRHNGFEGQLALWRLRSSWRAMTAVGTIDGPASSSSPALLTFDTSTLEAGWAAVAGGSSFSFDPVAAGGAYSPTLSYVFLVAVTVEAEITSGTAEGLLEIAVQYSSGSGIGTLRDRAFATSYAEGAAGTTVAVAGWLGLVEGPVGEPGGLNLERLAVAFLNRNTNATTFTPKASRYSLQIVAIPRAELEYAHADKDVGGQPADIDGALIVERTRADGLELDHDPARPTELLAANLGGFVLGMGSAYSSPLSGTRNGARLNQRLELARDGAHLAQCGGMAHDRGTNGCDRAGINAHGIVELAPGQVLEAFHDRTN